VKRFLQSRHLNRRIPLFIVAVRVLSESQCGQGGYLPRTEGDPGDGLSTNLFLHRLHMYACFARLPVVSPPRLMSDDPQCGQSGLSACFASLAFTISTRSAENPRRLDALERIHPCCNSSLIYFVA
jgi:hypothetical protein